jgi:hypothetical protein
MLKGETLLLPINGIGQGILHALNICPVQEIIERNRQVIECIDSVPQDGRSSDLCKSDNDNERVR